MKIYYLPEFAEDDEVGPWTSFCNSLMHILSFIAGPSFSPIILVMWFSVSSKRADPSMLCDLNTWRWNKQWKIIM